MRQELAAQFKEIIGESFQEMIRRYQKHPDYHFLDTKYDLINNRDCFDTQDEESFFRSKNVVYTWIQGRGLESLADHAMAGYGDLKPVCDIVAELVESILHARHKNNGRMFFMMSPEEQWINSDGSPYTIPMEGEANYSELFVSKGLVAAAELFDHDGLMQDALNWLDQLTEAVENLRFVTDQQSFDPANPVTAQPGKILMGPFMIALSGIARAARLTGDEHWLDKGKRFIQRVLDVHITWHDGIPDIFEAVHPDTTPWLDGGKQFSDPGHGLEFVGLAQNFLFILESAHRPQDNELIARCRRELPILMKELFRRGFNCEAGGIIKSYDLIERKPINRDMPWWNLPETIRAAVENEKFCGTDQTKIITACAQAFLQHFVLTEHHCFAWQTRNAQGEPARAIPAVPDLDPGYHTNLSLLDVLKIWQD